MEKVVPWDISLLFASIQKHFLNGLLTFPTKEKLLENKHSSIIFIISQTESLFCYLVDSIKNFKLGGEDEGICHAKWHVKCKISPFSSSQVVFASVQTILKSPKESKSLMALNFAGKLAPIGTPKCRN